MQRGQGRRGRSLRRSVAFAALAAIFAAVPANAAFDCGTHFNRCQAQIDDSGRVWFPSYEKLTEDALGDGTLRGGVFQIYERSGETTTLVSRAPDGAPIPGDERSHVAASLYGVSPDGERVYITTQATLSPEDGDGGNGYGSQDKYELSNGGFRLLSTGPLDGPFPNPNATFGSQRLWASDDGAHVYFETGQRLTDDDTDNASDLYVREGTQTRLVSTGPAAVPSDPNLNRPAIEAGFLGVSTDGATAFFSSPEKLTADDTEALTSDIFSWKDGVTRKLTNTIYRGEGPGIPYEIFEASSFGGVAEDGSLFYRAFSPQAPEDTDAEPDLYATRPDGSTQLLTAAAPTTPTTTGAFLRAEAASRDGSRVFFTTNQAFVAADRDETLDIYMWSAGALQLLSVGTNGNPPHNAEELHFDAVSRDGRRVYFETYERLATGDTDEEADVYEWSEGAIRLVSPASTEGRQSWAFFRGLSPNGRYVAFATFEPLLGSDRDAKEDIYVIDMGPAGGASAARAASARPAGRGGQRRSKRRLRLVTAEAIPPRMTIGARGTFGAETARVRLRCPKTEHSGPCHGRVRLLSRKAHELLAAGSFRIGSGHGDQVVLKGRRLPGGKAGRLNALARVRGADSLGNAAVVSHTVELRRAHR